MSRAVRAPFSERGCFEARNAAGSRHACSAEKAGITHTAVNGIEKGTRSRHRHDRGAAQALGVSPCWLAYGIGPKEDTDDQTREGVCVDRC